MKKLSLILYLISLLITSVCLAMNWFHAAKMGNIETLQQLIQSQPEWINKPLVCGMTPLNVAAYYGKDEAVRLLSDNVDIYGINYPNNNGISTLHYAVQNCSEDVVRTLLKKGANVNQTDNHGYTPLHGAAKKGRLSVVRILIEKGAVINKINKIGLSPLDLATSCDNKNVAKFLEICLDRPEHAQEEIIEFMEAMK